jgi:hypothetical protein
VSDTVTETPKEKLKKWNPCQICENSCINNCRAYGIQPGAATLLITSGFCSPSLLPQPLKKNRKNKQEIWSAHHDGMTLRLRDQNPCYKTKLATMILNVNALLGL